MHTKQIKRLRLRCAHRARIAKQHPLQQPQQQPYLNLDREKEWIEEEALFARMAEYYGNY